MRKILTAALAALTLAGGLAATTAPVQAQTRHGGGYHGGYRGGGGYRSGGYGHGGGWGWGVGAGLAGFALGSALASPYYYSPGYYGDGYGYGSCVGTQRVWDPYYGGYVLRRYYYAC